MSSKFFQNILITKGDKFMALYEFKCKECGTKMEILQKFNDPDPICGCGFVMKRQISHSSFVLKGSGWYASDYKTDTPKDEVKEASTAIEQSI